MVLITSKGVFMKYNCFTSVFASVASLLVASSVYAVTYSIDAAHSSVAFKVKHLGISSVVGRFNSFEGSVEFDPKNVGLSKAEASLISPA